MTKIKKLLSLGLLGIVLSWTGGYLNEFVVKHNHGQMPVWCINDHVTASVLFDPDHSQLTKTSHYIALSDIFLMPGISDEGIKVEDIMSLGDLLIFSGSALIGAIELVLPICLILDVISLFKRRKRGDYDLVCVYYDDYSND